MSGRREVSGGEREKSEKKSEKKVRGIESSGQGSLSPVLFNSGLDLPELKKQPATLPRRRFDRASPPLPPPSAPLLLVKRAPQTVPPEGRFLGWCNLPTVAGSVMLREVEGDGGGAPLGYFWVRMVV